MHKMMQLNKDLFLSLNRFLSTSKYSTFFWLILSYLNHYVFSGLLYPIFLLLLVISGSKFRGRIIWIFFFLDTIIFLIRISAQTAVFHKSVLIGLLINFIVSFLVVKITKNYDQMQRQKLDLILTLANTLDSKDSYTAFHSENVANYALKIAKEMKLPKMKQEAIYLDSLIHDIGKIGIKENILTKPAKLTEEEYRSIKEHPNIGFQMIQHITPFHKNGILDIVLYHHERYDGKGYPNNLKGENIPLEARIMCVTDSFDAMTSKRSYREDRGIEWAVQEIKKNRGTQFDPSVVQAFLSIWKREGTGIRSHVKVL